MLFWGSTAFLLLMLPPLDMLMNVAALIVVGVLVFYVYRPDLSPLVLVPLYNRIAKKKKSLNWHRSHSHSRCVSEELLPVCCLTEILQPPRPAGLRPEVCRRGHDTERSPPPPPPPLHLPNTHTHTLRQWNSGRRNRRRVSSDRQSPRPRRCIACPQLSPR